MITETFLLHCPAEELSCAKQLHVANLQLGVTARQLFEALEPYLAKVGHIPGAYPSSSRTISDAASQHSHLYIAFST